MKPTNDVAIVGAGPYGLSLAAYLEARGVDFRIFGPPMEVWRSHMPAGMHLKSDGFASNLYDPAARPTLARYCTEHRIAYSDLGVPVALETFVAYGLDFQRQVVPQLETTRVLEVARDGDAYLLRLAGGQTARARSVVMATGISYSGHRPESLQALGALCTHSFEHHDLAGFRGRRVAVVGAGASATDIAALLHEAGAQVCLVSREAPQFHVRGSGQPGLWERLTRPNLGLGPNFRSAVYTALPGVFHFLPRRLRLRIVRRHLGPAGGWFMRDRVLGRFPIHSGVRIAAATAAGGVARLELVDGRDARTNLEVDHVIAATGYRVDVGRVEALAPSLRAALETEDGSPRLTRSFESSAPGLYFIGVSAANSFGPSMRFARGAEYVARRLSAHLASRYAGVALARRKPEATA